MTKDEEDGFVIEEGVGLRRLRVAHRQRKQRSIIVYNVAPKTRGRNRLFQVCRLG
jgi:hypothetical protein